MTAATLPKRLVVSTGSGVRRQTWKFRRVIFFAVVLATSLVAGVFYIFERIPLPPDVIPAESSIIYDANGHQLAQLSGEENRVYVKLSEVPKIVQDAVIVREDKDFYSHPGVDPWGIARATWSDVVSHKRVEGGSTITQQYVKNTYVGNKRSIARKIREAAISVRLESEFSKSQILERYLNAIYFGRGAYGVSSAAHAYFNKDVKDLGVNEAAYLAGLISNPNSADINVDLKLATTRRDEVLAALKDRGKITKEVYEASKAVPLTSFVIDKKQQEPSVARSDIGTQYFVEEVRQELVKRYGEDVVLRGGLRVTTTIDLDQQAKAFQAVYGSNKPAGSTGALVAINTKGEVTAMVGGKDWEASKVNLAEGTQGGGTGRQPGSTFKAIMLAELIREGYSIDSQFDGTSPYTIPKGNGGKDYVVDNAEPGSGTYTVSSATVHSVNAVYAQLVQLLGPDKLVDMAKKLGITSPLTPEYSLVLGSEEVSPLEMASVYSTFMDHGIHIDPHLIKEVRTSDGKLLSGSAPKSTRVLTAAQADTVTSILQQVITSGTGGPAAYGGPAAGKTGTTQDHADAWFVGYNPQITAAVWVGNPAGRVSMPGAFGGPTAGPLWRKFMTAMFKGVSVPGFTGTPIHGGKILVNPFHSAIPSTTTSVPTDTPTSVTEQPPDTTPTTNPVVTITTLHGPPTSDGPPNH